MIKSANIFNQLFPSAVKKMEIENVGKVILQLETALIFLHILS